MYVNITFSKPMTPHHYSGNASGSVLLPEILIHIFKYLDVLSKKSVAQVSINNNQQIRDNFDILFNRKCLKT